MSIQALRERKQALHRDANHLLAEKGDQVWSGDDKAKFDELMNEAERVVQQIEAHQRLLDQAAERNFGDAAQRRAANADGHADDPAAQARKGFETFLRIRPQDLTNEQRTLIRNTMSTTTGSQGGFTVQPEVSREFVDTLKDYMGMRRVADRVVTGNGADLTWPTTDGTAEVGELVTQNTVATAADAVFGSVPLNTYKYSSKIITVPYELLQDSAIDVVGLVNKRMRDRIGRIMNQHFSTGTGTAQPFGVATAAAVGKVGNTGQTTTMVYDDLVDLVDSIDVAYQQQDTPFFWLMSQTMRRVVRKIKDVQGRPIWTPSDDEGISNGFPDLLLGYPVNINNDMPAPAANAKSVAFGQMKKYMIRDVMEIIIQRYDDSAYASKGQVGFLAWARAGGNLIDTAAVKLYQHSAT